MAVSSVQATQPSTPYDDMLCEKFGQAQCGTARRIMWCESRGNPNAIGGANYGLMQINRIHAPEFTINNDPREFLDPEFNIEVAYVLYQRRGWQPWSGCL